MEGYSAEIFVPTEFEEETFTFGERQQRLLCSKAATTDYDFTGLIVWPASQVLAWYLLQTPEVVEGKHVMEVGAGCGLTGFVAAQAKAASVTLTDGSPHVLELLRSSRQLNSDAGATCDLTHSGFADLSPEAVRVAALTWGDAASSQELLHVCEAEGSWPTVILGADVFQSSFGSPALLFSTVKQFFLAAKEHGVGEECAFYTCFALRATTKEDIIAECAEEAGFEMQKPCIRDMLPAGVRPDDFTSEKLRLVKYSLKL